MLSNGLHEVPPGHVASVVTHLEMTSPPAPRPEADLALDLCRVAHPGTDWYRALFRKVGRDWLWSERLKLEETALRAILDDPAVHVFALRDGAEEVGLLELDFRQEGACELAYFGLVPGYPGRGAGRWMMNRALRLAWAEGIARVHVHTCTLDHPAALDFYRRSGFTPCRRQVEITRDPRLSGTHDRGAAPRIPLIV